MNHTRTAALVALTLLTAGCTRQASVGQGSGPSAAGGPTTDPWQTAVAELRKPNVEVTTTRRVLSQLNADLSGKTSVPVPEPTPEADARRLAEALRLTDEEVREVHASSYTGLDAAYLAEAVYLRDAAKSLEVTKLPPEKQAAVGLAWVCRMVYLRPWVIAHPEGGQAYAPPVPPTAVLRRGYGTGLERAYVLLALLRQLGLDGCLVGPPGQEQAGVQKVIDNKPWKGPFWAVGMAAGGDLFLFDPWRGEPVPGPGGKGVGTLGQLKKAPDQVKAWREDKANPWDVSAKDVAEAVAYAAVPLSAVPARTKLLETRLATGGVGVRLADDPREAADRLAKAQAPAAVWAPPAAAEMFAYTRVLASFLPKADGGLAPADVGLDKQLVYGLVPPFRDAAPEGLTSPEAAEALRSRLQGAFAAVFVDTPLRERIHRGQFNEASRLLVEVEKPFAAAEQRGRDAAARAAAVKDWVEKANQAYRRLSTSRLPENRADQPAAEAEVAAFWRQELRGLEAVTDRSLAAAGMAEVGYLLAVCKHEQAERAQLRFEQAAARPGGDRVRAAAEQARKQAEADWLAAQDAWQRYAPYAAGQAATVPGRADHAKRLSARAARLAANPAADS